jgi:ribosomal protein L13E
LAAVVLVGVVAAGCSNPRPGRATLVRELEDAGLSAEQARCVVDGMGEEFVDRRLDTRDEPSRLERARMNRVLAACGVETRYPELVPPPATTTTAP